jgi:hypothetical protein
MYKLIWTIIIIIITAIAFLSKFLIIFNYNYYNIFTTMIKSYSSHLNESLIIHDYHYYKEK